MATKEKQQTAFKGRKLTMKNITVRKYIPSGQKNERYMIFKGKGTGAQMSATDKWEDVLFFDKHLSELVYKTIYSKKDGRKGGAYFLGNKMAMTDHPFISEGYTFTK